MGEIRIVGPDKTRGYPYPVCKKTLFLSRAIIGLTQNLFVFCVDSLMD